MTYIKAPWLDSVPAQTVCRMLTDAGYQAWFVGGCVRNTLLGEPVADLDLSTDAHPDIVMSLAKSADIKAIPTGVDHGTVTLVVDDIPFEITTYRRDVATDGRHATVAFADNIIDDARRRDFTMNALYADAKGMIADPLGGLPDLQARRICFIEDPDMRIKEDYLRILRFFRFYAWYGDINDGLDADGLAACAANIDGLSSLSTERTTAELLKLLGAPDPAPAAASMSACGALGQVLPGADVSSLGVLVHFENQVGVQPDPLRRLAVIGGDVATYLRLSKNQMRRVVQIKNGRSPTETAYFHGFSTGIDTALVQSASIGQPLDDAAAHAIKHASEQVFPLKAADLMPLLSGRALGDALKTAEQRWIASGFTLTKAELLD